MGLGHVKSLNTHVLKVENPRIDLSVSFACRRGQSLEPLIRLKQVLKKLEELKDFGLRAARNQYLAMVLHQNFLNFGTKPHFQN